MANFQLRDVDNRLWSQIMVRAQLEGWPLKELILRLLDDYQAGRLAPSQPPPMAPARMRADHVVVLKFTCPHCNKAMEVDCQHRSGFGYTEFHAIECPHCHKVTERALPGAIVAVHAIGGKPAESSY